MYSYIPTYYRLRKSEPLIALGSQQGGHLISTSAVLQRGGVEWGEGRFEHPRLAEVVLNFTARAVSRRANFNPIPAKLCISMYGALTAQTLSKA